MHVPAEDGITQADSYFLLEDAATTYKLEKFPHLAGCKVLTVPNLLWQEVGQHIRPWLLAPNPLYHRRGQAAAGTCISDVYTHFEISNYCCQS